MVGVERMTSDYGLLYRQPFGRGNPAFVFLWAATALGQVCSSVYSV